MESDGKPIALITGANRGIGFELARTLARDCNFHVLLGARSASSGTEAAAILQKEGLAVSSIIIDVASDSSVLTAARTIERKYNRLDVLVNNAGIMPLDTQDTPFETKRETQSDSRQRF